MESDRDQRRQEIERRVIELATEQAGVDPATLTRETHFVNDLNFDSLDVMDLVIKLEDEFEISIEDDKVEQLKTVGAVVDYIADHVPSEAPSA